MNARKALWVVVVAAACFLVAVFYGRRSVGDVLDRVEAMKKEARASLQARSGTGDREAVFLLGLLDGPDGGDKILEAAEGSENPVFLALAADVVQFRLVTRSYDRATVLESQDRLARLLDRWAHADPDNGDPLLRLGWLSLERARPEEGIRRIEEAAAKPVLEAHRHEARMLLADLFPGRDPAAVWARIQAMESVKPQLDHVHTITYFLEQWARELVFYGEVRESVRLAGICRTLGDRGRASRPSFKEQEAWGAFHYRFTGVSSLAAWAEGDREALARVLADDGVPRRLAVELGNAGNPHKVMAHLLSGTDRAASSFFFEWSMTEEYATDGAGPPDPEGLRRSFIAEHSRKLAEVAKAIARDGEFAYFMSVLDAAGGLPSAKSEGTKNAAFGPGAPLGEDARKLGAETLASLLGGAYDRMNHWGPALLEEIALALAVSEAVGPDVLRGRLAEPAPGDGPWTWRAVGNDFATGNDLAFFASIADRYALLRRGEKTAVPVIDMQGYEGETWDHRFDVLMAIRAAGLAREPKALAGLPGFLGGISPTYRTRFVLAPALMAMRRATGRDLGDDWAAWEAALAGE